MYGIFEIVGKNFIESLFSAIVNRTALDVYNETCEIINPTIEDFNTYWFNKHPDADVSDPESQDAKEYNDAHERYFKRIADQVSMKHKLPGGRHVFIDSKGLEIDPSFESFTLKGEIK